MVVRVLMIAYTTWIHDGRVKRHAQALAERGDCVDVLCLDNPEAGRSGDLNVIGLRVPRYRGSSRAGYLRTYLRFFAAATLKACRLALRQKYDIIIVCTMPDAAVLCALPTKLMGAKVVLDIHDTMPELYREKFGGRRGALGARLLGMEERASTWFADRVLAVHELHRQRLAQAGVEEEKIRVVLNAPDPKIFTPRANGRAKHRRFTVLCHGTVAKRLGVDVAIRAMGLLRDRGLPIHLAIIGAGDYLADLKRLALHLGLRERVDFLSPVPLERLPSVLQRASAGLVPNRASSATHLMLPVKLLEYAALGIPIVAARLRTIEHYFDDSTLTYFEPGNAQDLARAVEELYHHPDRRSDRARNAMRAIQSISWEQQRAAYYDALDSVLASGSGIVHRGRAPERSAEG
jgi:glycosyltransferase involved in cell wall biosynthesis